MRTILALLIILWVVFGGNIQSAEAQIENSGLFKSLENYSMTSSGREAKGRTVVKKAPVVEGFGFHLAGKRKSVRVPFEHHANLILVPVLINDSDTLRFILDTGVSATIVTAPEVFNGKSLLLTRKVDLVGAGEGEPLSAHIAINNVVRMGGVQSAHRNIVVLDRDALNLSEFVGVPVHGIFGYEIFSNFVVTIDFTNKELLVMEPGHYSYKKRKGDKYNITVEDSKPFTNIVTMTADGREHSIKVAIDTGAGHALLLDPSAKGEIQVPDKVVRALLGRGLNGAINGDLGRVESVRLGRFQLEDVVTSFPDSISFNAKIPEKSDRQGNIGCELLRRFKVTLNYKDQYMVLKPVRRRMREKFEHDMSGLELRAAGYNYRSYLVNHVQKDSPAERAGLLEGDELVFINHTRANELHISDIYKLLQKGDGKSVEILVRRKSQLVFAQVKLRRMI